MVLTDVNDSSKTFKRSIDENETIIIGRVIDKADWVIDYDQAISSSQCKIQLISGKLYITDDNSSNGTYIDNIRINNKTEIKPGQLLKLGRPVFKVYLIKE